MDILEYNVLENATLVRSEVNTKENCENEDVSFNRDLNNAETGNINASVSNTQDKTKGLALGSCDMANVAQGVINNIMMIDSNICYVSENLGSFQGVGSKDVDRDLEVDTKLSTKQVQKSDVECLNGMSKKHNRNLTVLDSNSDSESYNNDLNKGNTTNITIENELKGFKLFNKKKPTFLDSDSESEDIPHSTNFNSNIVVGNHTEDEPWNGPTTPCSSINETEFTTIQKCVSSVTKKNEMKVENVKIPIKTSLENCHLESHNNVQKSRLALLCDSDSDEESSNNQPNSPNRSDNDLVEQSQHELKIDRKSKIPWLNKNTAKCSRKMSKTKNLNAEFTKKMTAKEAAELRKTIQSESQRMVREKNISLPYHKPKAHSLKEFLARRPRLAVAVSTGPEPPSVAIKMSTKQLELISKKMKEREKEVKNFYKSESESDNDGDEDYLPQTIYSKNEEEKKNNVNETAENSQDQENDATRAKNSESIANAQDDVTKTSNKDNQCQEKIHVEPENGLQESVDFQRDIHNSASVMEIGRVERTTDVEEPNETKDKNETELCNSSKTGIVPRGSTESYDFQLDDENTEKIVSSNHFDINQVHTTVMGNVEKSVLESRPIFASKGEFPSKPFTYTNLDMEIENFGKLANRHTVTEEDFNEHLPPVKSKLDILKERLTNIKPKLSGGPDKVIDLSSAVVNPKEVVELMERFTKHMTAKKHQSKHKVKLSIVTVESGGDIHKETVAVNVDSDNEADIHEEKPGAKLQKLKEELQKQMDQKKSDIWQQKAAKGIRGCEAKDGKHNDKEYDGSIYDDEKEEEEEEMTEEEESEEEWENDVDLSDQPTRKSAFLEQEAEESGNDSSHKDDYEEGTLNEEEVLKEYEVDDDDDDDDDSNLINERAPSESENEMSVGKKKVLKRILKPDDDSDEEDLFSNCATQKTSPNVQLDSTVTADEDDIPPHQTRQLQTPMRQAQSQAKSISDFLTPISFITSIQNLASATKSYKNGPVISPFRMPQDQSSTPGERSAAVSQKKLFTDSKLADSQGSFDAPITQTEELSSDMEQDNGIVSFQGTQSEINDEPPCTQDLIGICSGEFTGVTQIEPSDEIKTLVEFTGSQSAEHNILGTDQDMIISQLLDEEELENFKKKFQSPVNPITQRSISDETQEITGGGIIDSDDEDNEKCGLRKKRNQRRIQFSDDDSSDDNSDEEKNSEEIDLQDNDTDEEINNIEYDSEENEIDFNNIGKKEKMKMADFFEAEAELSESEWGSEDEDENDMDKLEFELGDTEKFDEEQVKEDLEKIHLRRMLDDDAREVKLLQEVLLEDGEMHGTGRQRQFKWKNIDLSGDQIEEKKDDDEIYLDEEESEEHWRKKRHEREMFLQEKQHKSQHLDFEDRDLLNHSQILKIGQKVLQRNYSQNSSQNNTPIDKNSDIPSSPISNVTFSLSSKRGSFLSRGDRVLKRVAEYTRSTIDISTTSIKTTKNFVFQSISASEESVVPTEDKKRKASDGTPNVLKKLRLNTNLSPALKKTERAKKLFNF